MFVLKNLIIYRFLWRTIIYIFKNLYYVGTIHYTRTTNLKAISNVSFDKCICDQTPNKTLLLR